MGGGLQTFLSSVSPTPRQCYRTIPYRVRKYPVARNLIPDRPSISVRQQTGNRTDSRFRDAHFAREGRLWAQSGPYAHSAMNRRYPPDAVIKRGHWNKARGCCPLPLREGTGGFLPAPAGPFSPNPHQGRSHSHAARTPATAPPRPGCASPACSAGGRSSCRPARTRLGPTRRLPDVA